MARQIASAVLPRRLRHKFGSERRRAELVVFAGFATAAITLGLALARFVVEGSGSTVGWLLAVAAVGFTVVPAAVLKLSGLTAAAASLPALAVVTLAAMGIVDGGVHSDAMVWFPFIPVVGALSIGRRGAIAGSAAALAAVAAIIWCDAATFSSQTMLKGMASAGAVVFGGVLAALYERGRERAYLEAENARRRSEAVLAAIPDTLVRISQTGVIHELRQLPEGYAWLQADSKSNAFCKGIRGQQLLAQLRETGESRGLTQQEYLVPTAEGPTECEVRMVPYQDEDVIALIRDVSERVQFERLKDDFVSSVSHELRTPLTALGGAVQLLRGGSMSQQQTQQLLDVGARNVTRLGDLVETLLEFRRLSAESPPSVAPPADVAQLLHEHVEALPQANHQTRIEPAGNEQSPDDKKRATSAPTESLAS